MVHPPSRIVYHPEYKKLNRPLPAHPLSKRPLVFVERRILIPGFIRSTPTLAVYDVPPTLPLGSIGRGYPFAENETRRHFSYFSVKEFKMYNKIIFSVVLYVCETRSLTLRGEYKQRVFEKKKYSEGNI